MFLQCVLRQCICIHRGDRFEDNTPPGQSPPSTPPRTRSQHLPPLPAPGQQLPPSPPLPLGPGHNTPPPPPGPGHNTSPPPPKDQITTPPPPPRTKCACGRYASCWDAFLLAFNSSCIECVLFLCMLRKEILHLTEKPGHCPTLFGRQKLLHVLWGSVFGYLKDWTLQAKHSSSVKNKVVVFTYNGHSMLLLVQKRRRHLGDIHTNFILYVYIKQRQRSKKNFAFATSLIM